MKDFRFVGVMSYALDVPGIPIEHGRVPASGVRILEGTHDVIIDEEDGQLQEKAYRYAAEYNALLMQYLKQHHMTPATPRG